MVKRFFDRQEAGLLQRLGGRLFERPQIPVNLLRIHLKAWNHSCGSYQPPTGEAGGSNTT